MSTPTGRFVWYELNTTDLKAAEAFYGHVVGWRPRDAGMPEPYTLMCLGEGEAAPQVAGLMTTPPEALANGAPPAWTGYITVPDVDGDARRIVESGGRLCAGPMDIPGIGRFAVVADPQGAFFALFKPLSAQAPQGTPAPGTPGTVAWHELHASDLDAAVAFYKNLFGWTLDEALDMGPAGKYQLFRTGPDQSGGMMRKMVDSRFASWSYYIAIEDIDAGVGRVTDRGGQVLHGPAQVPGGSWIANCRDPQGAMFSLVGPRKE